MKALVSLAFTLSSISLGVALVLTMIDFGAGWLSLALYGAAVVLGVAAFFGARLQHR